MSNEFSPYLSRAGEIIIDHRDWFVDNIQPIKKRARDLGDPVKKTSQAIVEIWEEQHTTHPTEEKTVAQQAIAYEQCSGNKDVAPMRDMRRMNQTFEAWKQQMRNTNDDPNETHFLKIVAQELDGESATKFDTYESDCAHTRP